MTIKEKLYKEFIIKQNKVNRLTGNDLYDESDEYFNSCVFSNEAKGFTKQELTERIECAERSYEYEVDKLRIENYYNTEEGKARKEMLETEMDSLRNEVNEYKRNMEKKMNAVIKEWLGDSWGVHVYDGSMEIGIIEEVKDNGYFNFYFGRDFDIYFSSYISKKGKFRFELNYGTTGSFNPFEDNIHREFVIGMGKFLGNTEKMEEIKNETHEYVRHLEVLAYKISDLHCELKNPLNYKKVV